MTVKELIKELEKCDPEALVIDEEDNMVVEAWEHHTEHDEPLVSMVTSEPYYNTKHYAYQVAPTWIE